MNINELSEGISEAIWQYLVETAEQEQAVSNPNPAGLEPKKEAEKTDKKVATEKRVKTSFSRQE